MTLYRLVSVLFLSNQGWSQYDRHIWAFALSIGVFTIFWGVHSSGGCKVGLRWVWLIGRGVRGLSCRWLKYQVSTKVNRAICFSSRKKKSCNLSGFRFPLLYIHRFYHSFSRLFFEAFSCNLLSKLPWNSLQSLLATGFSCILVPIQG